MFIVLGATGHVGSAVVENLLRAGENVTAVICAQGKAEPLRSNAAAVAIVDIEDAQVLQRP